MEVDWLTDGQTCAGLRLSDQKGSAPVVGQHEELDGLAPADAGKQPPVRTRGGGK